MDDVDECVNLVLIAAITADLRSPALGLPFKIKHFLFCPYHSGSIFECVFGVGVFALSWCSTIENRDTT